MSYVRLVIKGTMGSGEVWTINPVFDPTGEFPGWDQAKGDAALAAVNGVTVPSFLLSALSSAGSVVGARLEARNDSDDKIFGLSEGPRPSNGLGTGQPLHPAQTAMVTSLRTATAGPRGRGRLYWPAVGVAIGTDLRVSSTNVGNMLNNMKSYLLALATALQSGFTGIPFAPAVRSVTSHTTPHLIRLQVGDVLDTQRRRRDALPEQYQAVAIP